MLCWACNQSQRHVQSCLDYGYAEDVCTGWWVYMYMYLIGEGERLANFNLCFALTSQIHIHDLEKGRQNH